MALTESGSLIATQGLPPLTEIVRQGNSWYGKGVVTTASLGAAVPTTAAASTLWNGNSAGGKCLVIEALGCFADVSAGAACEFQMWAEPSIVISATVPSTVEAAAIRGLRLGTTYAGSAKISQTVTVTDNGWIPIGPVVNVGVATSLGAGQFVNVNGLFIIPPGYYLAMHASATNTTIELGYFYIWHEVQLNLP
jgi:hypothetical protein